MARLINEQPPLGQVIDYRHKELIDGWKENEMEIKKITIDMDEIKNPEDLKRAIAEAIGADVAEHITEEIFGEHEEARIAAEAAKAWRSNKEEIKKALERTHDGKVPEGEELMEIAFELGYCCAADKELREKMMDAEPEDEEE